MEILSTSTAETAELAQTLAKKVKPGMVLALFGDLGSGKTTFTSFLVKALGFDSRVQSPTFVIHREYKRSIKANPTIQSSHPVIEDTAVIANNNVLASEAKQSISVIHHVDLYRLTSKEEVSDIGLPETLSESHSLVLIEWPELAREILPPSVVKLYFTTIDENTRRIIVEGLNDL